MTPHTQEQAAPAAWHVQAKHILFGVLGLLTLFVIYNNERFIIDHSDPAWTYYFPVRWLLIPHGFAGAICLCLGASQFSTRLRQSHARVHRTLGRWTPTPTPPCCGCAISSLGLCPHSSYRGRTSFAPLAAKRALWFSARPHVEPALPRRIRRPCRSAPARF